MDTLNKLKEIENHFNSITIEQFEENLIKAGYEKREVGKMEIKEADCNIVIEDNYSSLEVEKDNEDFTFTVDWTLGCVSINKEQAKQVADFIYRNLA